MFVAENEEFNTQTKRTEHREADEGAIPKVAEHNDKHAVTQITAENIFAGDIGHIHNGKQR